MTNTRQRLPNRRAHELIDFEHNGFIYTAGIGRFSDGTVAEIFLNLDGKGGTALDIAGRDAAVLASLAHQHGATIDTIKHALIRNSDGSAAGALGKLLDMLAEQP